MISCFETVTQHISGRPFCTMSTEALEMIVKYAKNLVFCRRAKSGEGMYKCRGFFEFRLESGHGHICLPVEDAICADSYQLDFQG